MRHLPKEILHHILWYHTHTYHGLLSFRCISKTWKEASDTSPLWLICDLTFYCPKEYLLLRRRQFKIINDILIFIEWSAFIGSSVYKFYLFQPIVYTECIKVSCDNRIMLPPNHSVEEWFNLPPDLTQPLPIPITPENPTIIPTTISTTCFHNSLSVLYLSNREGYDEMMIGLFVSVFSGVLYLQYKINSDLTYSKHPQFSEESDPFDSSSSFPLLWSYSMLPFWLWAVLSAVILWSRAKTIHLAPAVLAVSTVIGLIGCLCTVILLYLDRLLSEWWYQTSLTVIAMFNTLLTIVIIALLNYFLVLYHEIRHYPMIIDIKLVRRLGILIALILFLSLMVASSSILIIEMRLAVKLFPHISSLSWLLTYFFGFHGVITTKLLDEILAHYWEV